MALLKRICVYCGSSDRIPPTYLQAARRMGLVLAERGLTLVYGAGGTGMMGALADAVLEAGGQVVGVVPHLFDTPALIHPRLSERHVVEDMHQRKARMIELADAFIALPGGFGTFEELFEVLTWAQIGLHANPVGLLNVQAYFDPLLTLLQHAQQEGFLYAEHRSLLLSDPDPAALLDRLEAYRPPDGLERWLTREEKAP